MAVSDYAAINEKWWQQPVVLELGGIGDYRIVRNTREAAEVLLEKWPTHEGAAYGAALRMCRYVLNGEQPADYAREDFIAAAVEAFIHIDEGRRRF
ncbi:hypothetical protein ASG39_09120 [Rhizobium sp. Leaf371]|uniref:DUF982 domain-containing protein n=1 Tax=Rhizobium sp. Leaf371 TaxID=1736355 RepID=UPI0007158C77|nr:DUF982 domain-containing protein [Rhizobium sp. Leaf371]KQS65389.1 hypothetical protein ASG39_09120 [Rhizobium sp. Leaf371]